jgi:NADPH:quinone reductase-like Zn-dependent oxidoreductase
MVHLDGENRTNFILKTAKYLKNVLPPDLNEINRQYFNFKGDIYTKVFDWEETMGADVMFTSDNMVSTGEFKIGSKKDILSIFQDKEYLMKLGAFEYVSLSAEDAQEYLPPGYSSEESVVLMPAFLFHYVVNEKHFEQILKDFSTLADVGISIATLGSYTAGKTAVKVATKSAKGALIDFGIQAFINTLDGTSWKDAVEEVDYGNVAWAAAFIHIDENKAMYAFNCIRQGMQGALYFDNESLKEAILKGGEDCLYDAFLSLISSGMMNLTDNTSKMILKKLNSSPAFVTKRLLDFGVEKEVIESFIKGITKESIKQTIANTIRNYEQEE